MKKILIIAFFGLGCGVYSARYYFKDKAKVTEVKTETIDKPHADFMTADAHPLEAGRPVFIKTKSTPAIEEQSDVDILIEDRLLSNLSEDAGIRKLADVSHVQCQGIECTVAVEAKDPEDSGVQMAVLKFLQTHPEFGNSFTINDSKDDKRVTLFTFVRGSVEK